jgi:hypothetical protein
VPLLSAIVDNDWRDYQPLLKVTPLTIPTGLNNEQATELTEESAVLPTLFKIIWPDLPKNSAADKNCVVHLPKITFFSSF